MVKVRVRFAPSPTGPLHIGGARTALFNYLFAKRNKGDFLLRFEDTDEARSKKEYIGDIKEGLSWLALKWDEEYYQSQRLKIYQKYANQLLKKDLAYKDKGAIYFHIPVDQEVVFTDLIRGEVSFRSRAFKDFPILKGTGTPTFHFANVVDDALMKITHVIRGEDHLSNTPLHLLLYRALDLRPPYFVHIPLILNSNRSKMSKRSGEVRLSAYREKGILPEAMINFLVQLGWSDPKGREYFTLQELTSAFDLNRVQKAGAVFDYPKLLHYNHYYLRQKAPNEYLKLVRPHLQALKADGVIVKKFLPLMQERLQLLSDAPALFSFFFREPRSYPASLLIFQKSTKAATLQGLKAAEKVLNGLKEGGWRKENILKNLSRVVAESELQNGDLFWPVRVALTGEKQSPPPEEILAVLGKKKSLKRIREAIARLSS